MSSFLNFIIIIAQAHAKMTASVPLIVERKPIATSHHPARQLATAGSPAPPPNVQQNAPSALTAAPAAVARRSTAIIRRACASMRRPSVPQVARQTPIATKRAAETTKPAICTPPLQQADTAARKRQAPALQNAPQGYRRTVPWNRRSPGGS